jgi:hypothetical protein
MWLHCKGSWYIQQDGASKSCFVEYHDFIRKSWVSEEGNGAFGEDEDNGSKARFRNVCWPFNSLQSCRASG